jgi:hypothetical protein
VIKNFPIICLIHIWGHWRTNKGSNFYFERKKRWLEESLLFTFVFIMCIAWVTTLRYMRIVKCGVFGFIATRGVWMSFWDSIKRFADFHSAFFPWYELG